MSNDEVDQIKRKLSMECRIYELSYFYRKTQIIKLLLNDILIVNIIIHRIGMVASVTRKKIYKVW
jgi:hypothetical protein